MAAITSAVVGAVGVASSISASKKANKTAQAAQQSQEQILSRQQDIADEQWENYKTNYLPLEQEYLETAKNFGSIANQEKAAANASAATSGRFSNAREQLSKTPGLNPNSQQYLREAAKLNIAEAATSAAEQNKARESTEKTGAAMLQDAASLGKGIAGSAVSSPKQSSLRASGHQPPPGPMMPTSAPGSTRSAQSQVGLPSWRKMSNSSQSSCWSVTV